MSALGNAPGMVPNPGHALTPSGNLRRRQLTSRLFVGFTLAAAALAVAVLLILVYYVAKNGVSQLSLSFLTAQLPAPGGIVPGGGMGPALAGTAEVILIVDDHRAPSRRAHRDLPVGIRQPAHRQGADHRARADGRGADDPRRRLHLRTDRRARRAVGTRRRDRPRDRRGSADRAREYRVAAARTRHAARGG